jgi:hypothetical protein
MSIEPEPHSQNDFGSLQGCFVEGNPEQRKRERRIRRRALIISVATQAAILAAIILVPLFGKPEGIAQASVMPIPPYFHNNAPERTNTTTQQNPQRRHNVFNNVFSQPPRIPDRIDASPEPPSSEPPGIPSGPEAGTPCVGCIPMNDDRHQPPPPPPLHTPTRVLVGHLEPAMLIQSLQVVSGDALFLRSAIDAVSQWRYRATALNGQPVEIETYITVIYTLQH